VTPEQIEEAAQVMNWGRSFGWQDPDTARADHEFWRGKARVAARAFGLTVTDEEDK
jgi:hypothetical protein